MPVVVVDEGKFKVMEVAGGHQNIFHLEVRIIFEAGVCYRQEVGVGWHVEVVLL
jgi:hypothetical protein